MLTGGKHRDWARLVFVTDLHGGDLAFRRLLSAVEVWKPDALIVGGDIAGKGLLPIVAEPAGRFRLNWLGKEVAVENRSELAEFDTRARQLGYYPFVGSQDQIDELNRNPGTLTSAFEELIAERWGDWLELLEAKCLRAGIQAYVMAGNDDPWSVDEVTRKPRQAVVDADMRVVPILDRWVLLSCGLANQTPWKCPRDTDEPTLESKLETLVQGIGSFENVIANIHVPPYSSTLDFAPRLNTLVWPPEVIFGETAAVGSTAVRAFIERHAPLVGLHGHIHESRSAARIGRTWVFNPGSEYAEGVLRGVILTLEPGRLISHQFVTG